MSSSQQQSLMPAPAANYIPDSRGELAIGAAAWELEVRA